VTKLATPRAVAAVVVLFSYNGVVIGTYAAAIPSLQTRFALTPLMLSALFISIGVAAIASMQLGGRLADRLGARRVSLAMIPLLIIGIFGLGQAQNLATLFGFGMLLGFGNGGIDVAMNAIGVQVEKHRVKPIMSFFHGMWSVGNLVGAALLVSLSPWLGGQAGHGVQITTAIAAVLGVVALVISLRIVPETEPVAHTDESGARTPIPPAAYLLGLMAVAFGLGEGTGMDWSALLVTEVAGVDAVTGSLGVTVLAAFMVVIRLLGDFLVTRFGRRAVTRFGGACAASGYLVVALTTPLPLLLVGWALVGLGIGMIAPQVYAVAGHTAGGRGLAVVVTFGYATFLIAPAIIGALVSSIGIQATMLVPAALLTGLLALAQIMPPKQRPTAEAG
jgi:MFS family permease